MNSNNKLAVVIPAYNAAATLHDCLSGIAASIRKPDEVILYNDGSTDDTVEIATGYDVKVITNPGAPKGPAAGRNVCAHETDADILVFVDADVRVHPNALGDLETALLSAPDIAAAFGSYDDAPRSERTAALYANLRHHFYHQNSDHEATTFWSGFGAIKRDVFLTIGGFDPRFARPSIEDVDLGIRLRQAGLRIRLVPDAQAKHCKDWGLVQLWRTDIIERALPWSKLIVSGETDGADLNASVRERYIAVFAHLIWLSGFLSIIAPAMLIVFFASIVAYISLNFGFYKLLTKRGGVVLLLSGVLLHWLYNIYASSVFAYILLTHRGRKTKPAPSQNQDKAERQAS